jgi:hypothetical protein
MTMRAIRVAPQLRPVAFLATEAAEVCSLSSPLSRLYFPAEVELGCRCVASDRWLNCLAFADSLS